MAKAGRVMEPVERQKIPFNWAVNADGRYDGYRDPGVGNAYVLFSVEMRGGYNVQEKRIMADMELQRKAILERGQS
jgi:hypothetical protein